MMSASGFVSIGLLVRWPLTFQKPIWPQVRFSFSPDSTTYVRSLPGITLNVQAKRVNSLFICSAVISGVPK